MNIGIIIREKIARLQNPYAYFVCGNSDITIEFDFDEEWNEYEVKTARFSSGGSYIDKVFSGNTVNAPKLKNKLEVKIGVFAGDLHTTTPAVVPAKKSILCDGGTPEAPNEDVYAQIMQMINDMQHGGGSGGVVTIDSELSEKSTNAVQNKVITAAFNEVKTTVGNIDSLLETI